MYLFHTSVQKILWYIDIDNFYLQLTGMWLRSATVDWCMHPLYDRNIVKFKMEGT